MESVPSALIAYGEDICSIGSEHGETIPLPIPFALNPPMTAQPERLVETITLSQAKQLIRCLAQRQSLLLLSPPGVGKSDTVVQAAFESGLPCRSLLGTQIAPEDVSGIPRIIGERSVFCPPRILLPEQPEPFCLFLDELPACTPDIQKAFYSLLLERRLGEHKLPPGTWVVAAGNRAEDRALVRTISSALVNRVIVLQIRVDVDEWLAWAESHQIRGDVRTFIRDNRDALMREVPREPIPFSTPRSWALLSQALDLAAAAGILDRDVCYALAAGRVSPEDAQDLTNWCQVRENAEVDVEKLGLWNLLNLGIRELELSARAVHALEQGGLGTLRELVILDSKSLQKQCPELDRARIEEIEAGLQKKGLWLGMPL